MSQPWPQRCVDRWPTGSRWRSSWSSETGRRSASGYTYPADGSVSPVACGWNSIEPEVRAYLETYYEPGDLLRVKILVQFERATGRYLVTFEDTDEERWKTRPGDFRQMCEQLRQGFD